jgi:hypothetical protein
MWATSMRPRHVDIAFRREGREAHEVKSRNAYIGGNDLSARNDDRPMSLILTVDLSLEVTPRGDAMQAKLWP